MIALITPLLQAVGPWAVVLVALIVFAETGLLVGVVLSGNELLFTVGVMIAAHSVEIPAWMVLPVVVAAAVVGDQVGFLVGRRAGPRMFCRSGNRLRDPQHVERAHAFFAKHGPRAVVLAFFIPWARTFTPAVAGVGQMSRRGFTVCSMAGGSAWAAGILGVGYLFGGIPLVADHLTLLTLGMVAVSAVPASVIAGRKLLHRRRRARAITGVSAARGSRTARAPRAVPAAP